MILLLTLVTGSLAFPLFFGLANALPQPQTQQPDQEPQPQPECAGIGSVCAWMDLRFATQGFGEDVTCRCPEGFECVQVELTGNTPADICVPVRDLSGATGVGYGDSEPEEDDE
jgi:hypothetical protein